MGQGLRGVGQGGVEPEASETAQRASSTSDLPVAPAQSAPETEVSRAAGKWAKEELNLRPHAYQACALTT